ncbi:pyridoxal phosphate-dependent transferase [Naematelia encephala]|uniref:cystathionine gamma-synthase n=1 Tax=Naematelia encephala TaxID=71784 RepID=A0A1Y2AXZ5_9TREE|nr:pyridoxal phosphate-dependent transferase [Naematelia encephala]
MIWNKFIIVMALATSSILAAPVIVDQANEEASTTPTALDLVSLGELLNNEWANNEVQLVDQGDGMAAESSSSSTSTSSAQIAVHPKPEFIDLTTKPDATADKQAGETDVLPIVEDLFEVLGEDHLGRSLVKRGRVFLIEEPVVNGHQWVGADELTDEDDEPFWISLRALAKVNLLLTQTATAATATTTAAESNFIKSTQPTGGVAFILNMIATMSPSAIPLGSSVPAMTAHAISVSLPTWQDNVDYELGDKRVVDVMQSGYPRFFIHRSIQKLANLCLAKFGRPDELCILLCSPKVAVTARDFLASQEPPVPSRIVEFVICPSAASLPTAAVASDGASTSSAVSIDCVELHILLFDKSHWSFAKAFWQHTGDGISSRMAERALAFLGETPAGIQPATPTFGSENAPIKAPATRNRHYSRKPTSIPSTPTLPVAPTTPVPETPTEPVTDENLTSDLTTYLEERYGRNLPLFNAPLAKQALKRRIAGGLLPSDEGYGQVEDVARGGGPGRKAVTEDQVYLYPGGMSAIWHAHDICRKARRASGVPEGKSICYGFPYTDTYKILSKWGPGCHFFGIGGSEEVDQLAQLLASTKQAGEPPVLALFCEFPSNPLLRTPDLIRIRQLADEYGFVVVVDETIGNLINVEIVQFADIVVSSLSKIFSGDANVMGGSLIVNPNSAHYDALYSVLKDDYEDIYYPEDAVYMERNSRDYRNRIGRVNDNAYDLCEYLYSRSLDDKSSSSSSVDGKVIKKVYYPRYETPEMYEQARRKPCLGKGGYGGLFSLTFTTIEASTAFFNTLGCAKGPSLGTSFTLASPYTILAHYLELDWAAEYGVEAGLVRVSVGQEEKEVVMRWFEDAVKAAEKTLQM